MDKSVPNIVRSINISNFKSIRSASLSDCRRINVLIGRPNVGKSNILEALALFDVPYLIYSTNKTLKNIVRVENTADLFHNGVSTSSIDVRAGQNMLSVSRGVNNGLTLDINISGEESKYSFSSSLTLLNKKEPTVFPDILTYFFPKQFVAESTNIGFLLPPNGVNLMETVAGLPELRSHLASLFHNYGLKMMFDSGSQEIKAMRENGLDMYLVPFNSLADSLQRLIFYKAAIESNNGKIICFEEPEAHTFPPYITSVVNDIISDRNNQYFITTHSPYVINTILESGGDDVSVYVVDMNCNETRINRVTDRQVQEAYDNGMDMFYNLEAYIK